MPITAGWGSSSPGIGAGVGYGMGAWGWFNLWGEVSEARKERARYAIKIAATAAVVGIVAAPFAYRYAAWELRGLGRARQIVSGVAGKAAAGLARVESRAAGSAAAKYAQRTKLGRMFKRTEPTIGGQAGRGFVTGQVPGYGTVKTAQYMARMGARHPLTRARIAGGLIADSVLILGVSKWAYQKAGSPNIPFISGRGSDAGRGSRGRRTMWEEYAYKF